jgi:uncharacterized protein with GYD domain
MKVAFFFTLRPESVAGAMRAPTDRAAVLRESLRSVGGSLDAYYWMFGDYDGFVIADVPDNAAAAAMSLAVSSTGAFGHVTTAPLFSSEELTGILGRAADAVGSYTPPGG